MEDVDVPLTPEGNSEAAVDKYLSEQHMQGFSGGFRRPKIESPNQDLSKIQFQTLSVQVECVPLPRRYLGIGDTGVEQTIEVLGDDYYKVRKTAADEPDPFAVVYELYKRVLVPVGFAVRDVQVTTTNGTSWALKAARRATREVFAYQSVRSRRTSVGRVLGGSKRMALRMSETRKNCALWRAAARCGRTCIGLY